MISIVQIGTIKKFLMLELITTSQSSVFTITLVLLSALSYTPPHQLAVLFVMYVFDI